MRMPPEILKPLSRCRASILNTLEPGFDWRHSSPVAWLRDCSLIQLNGILGNSLYFLLLRGTISGTKLVFLAVWFLEYIWIYYLINLYLCGLEFAPTC